MRTFKLRPILWISLAFLGSTACGQQRQGVSPGSLPVPLGVAIEQGRDLTATYHQMGLIATGTPLSYVGKIAYFATRNPDSTLMLASISIPNRMLSFVRDGDTYRPPTKCASSSLRVPLR